MISFLFLCLTLLGCIAEDQLEPKPKPFATAPDTLKLKLHKVKGFEILGYSCTSLKFLDITETEIPALAIPKGIHDWKLS